MPRTVKIKPLNNIGPVLARPGDPLVLDDGSIIEEEVYLKLNSQEVDKSIQLVADPKRFKPIAKRVMRDFPANPQMFKAIGIVFIYTLYGIGNLEICDTLEITLDQLEEIRAHQGYADLFNNIFNEFINANSEMLQSRIAAYSRAAVSRVGHLVDNAKKEEVRLSASKDILDRAGMRPQDLTNAQSLSMNELQIRITKKTDDVIVDVHIGKHGVEDG